MSLKLGLLSGAMVIFGSAATASPIFNFVDDFAPSQWNLQPDQGQIGFANGNTELDIIGPTGNFTPSYDVVTVTGPSGAPQWELNFQWSFSAGDSEGSSATITWPMEPDGNPVVLASGGPGSTASGNLTLFLDPGDTATILLDTDETGAGKQPASLVINGFSYSVPDSTPWIEASLFVPLLMRRFLPYRGKK
jgi:hypothetical protein